MLGDLVIASAALVDQAFVKRSILLHNTVYVWPMDELVDAMAFGATNELLADLEHEQLVSRLGIDVPFAGMAEEGAISMSVQGTRHMVPILELIRAEQRLRSRGLSASAARLRGVASIVSASTLRNIAVGGLERQHLVGNQATEVLAIELRGMPTCDDQTDWGSLAQFRSDPDARNSFANLRKFISNVVRQPASQSTMNVLLDARIDSVTRAMQRHGIVIAMCNTRCLVALPKPLLALAERVTPAAPRSTSLPALTFSTDRVTLCREDATVQIRELASTDRLVRSAFRAQQLAS